jgi:hypothetical protein
MPKNTRRTPSEIIAEKQAELQRLVEREAQNKAANDPVYSELHQTINDLDKVLVLARKNLGTSPQGCQARIDAHEAWIDEINAVRELSEQQVISAKKCRDLAIKSINALVVGDQSEVNREVVKGVNDVITAEFDQDTLEAQQNFMNMKGYRLSLKIQKSETETIFNPEEN